MVRAYVVAGVASMLGGCSALLDFSDKAIPKDASIDAPDAPYTSDECMYKEPNDTLATAAMVAPTDVGPAAICPNMDGSEDHDFYKFTVGATTTMAMIQISFTNANGDLDLRLWDTANNTISQSRGFGDTETITCPGVSPPCSKLAAGDYIFEVFPAVTGATNTYAISLVLSP